MLTRHWEAGTPLAARTELTNHAADPSDEGTRSGSMTPDAEAKLVGFLDERGAAALGLSRAAAALPRPHGGNGLAALLRCATPAGAAACSASTKRGPAVALGRASRRG